MVKDEFDQYRELMETEDKFTIAVLKGHLVVESILDDISAELTSRGDLIEEVTRNSFHRKRLLAQAHAGSRSSDQIWEIVAKINALRNNVAHQIDSPKVEPLLEDLRRLLYQKTLVDTI